MKVVQAAVKAVQVGAKGVQAVGAVVKKAAPVVDKAAPVADRAVARRAVRVVEVKAVAGAAKRVDQVAAVKVVAGVDRRADKGEGRVAQVGRAGGRPSHSRKNGIGRWRVPTALSLSICGAVSIQRLTSSA